MLLTEEQKLAIEYEGKNILVSAGAGSGKTAVLSQRVIRKLKSGISIDDLLILTFTNASAEEMKSRIRNEIKKYPELKKEYFKINSAYITTFDAFSLSVLKKYHYKKDLPANITVSDKFILSIIKDQILEDMFNKYYENKDIAFENLIKDYALKDDEVIKNFIKSCHENIELIYNEQKYLDNYIDNFFENDFIESLIKKYLRLIENKIKNIQKIVEKISFIDKTYYEKLNFEDLFQAKEYEEIKLYSEIKLPLLNKSNHPELKTFKEKLSDELKELKDLCKYVSLAELKNDYLSVKKHTQTIINILKDFNVKLTAIKRQEHIYNFLDIAKLAVDIIWENEDVKLNYQNKFKEILIDEYQDTSDIQDLFINLISNNNVYMVGDLKQSIYRFRNANPDIFKAKYIEYQDEKKGKKIDLNKNFRSRAEVINNINLIFNSLMDEFLGGVDYRLGHNLIFGNNIYQKIELPNQNHNLEILNYTPLKELDFKESEIEIFIIARDIKNKVDKKYEIYDKEQQKKRTVVYSDFVILMDRSKNFILYKKIFEYLNIPLSIYKDESIKDSINLKIIKNILNLINKIYLKEFDVGFKYSFMSIGRSYLFELSDDYLYKVQVDNEYGQTKIYQICQDISLGLEEKNIYEILNEVIHKFEFYEKTIKIGDIENHHIVLEYLLNLAKASVNIYSLDEFILFLHNVIEGKEDIKYKLNKESNKGVILMTIHGSKGLEFPIVYFSGLYEKFNLKELNGMFNFNKDLGIILPVKKEYLDILFLKNILKSQYLHDEISEKIRLFYVALTRAKEKLIFVTNLKDEDAYSNELGVINNLKRENYRSFNDILVSLKTPISPYFRAIDIKNLGLTKEYNYIQSKHKLNDLTDMAKEPILVEKLVVDKDLLVDKRFSFQKNKYYDISTKANINLGINIHNILEYLDFDNPDYSNIDSIYIDYLNKFLSLDILKNKINIFKEYEFIFYQDNEKMHGIIDLLIEKETEFIIIDYKLKKIDEEKYLQQLQGYKNYLANISKKHIRTYLYSFIDNDLQEII